MMKTKTIFLLGVFSLLSVNVVNAQKGVEKFLTPKVMINELDRTIVAYVKPVKEVSVDTDKHYYWVSSNQINSTQGGYSGKLLNGSYQEFYINKNLKESGYLDKGLKTGLWKRWNQNGNLNDDYTWSDGNKHGIYHKYDSLGNVKETGKYKNNLLTGKQWLYTAEGVKLIRYKHGKVIERKKIKMPQFIRKVFHKKPKSM